MKIDIFARNLRLLRLSKKYTQEEMGIKLNIQRQTYCNYENGRRMPNLEILMEISSILDVTLDMLVSDTNSSSSDTLTVDQLSQETLLQLVSDFNSLPKSAQLQVIDFISFQRSRFSRYNPI